MAKIQLKEICSFSKGCQINGDELLENGEYDYLNGGINPSGKWNEYNVSGNTVTISEGGNSSGYVNYMPNPFWCGAHCYYLYELKCDVKYLYYALKSQQDKIMKLRSGACMPNIKKSDIGKFEFEYSSDTNVQKQIAANLDKVTHTIDLCNAILEKLDLLVKSRFVEMFGEPVSNTMNWDTVQLGELTTKIGSGATPKGGRESYGTEGISLIRSMNVHNGYFEYKDLAHISDEQAKKLDNVTVHGKDVLLNITGASVARCCIVPNHVLPARVNQHVCIIRCKANISPVFLCCVLTDENYQNHLWNIAGSGATREAITKQQVENLSIIVPPLALQEQFAAFVEQTDKSKLAVKQVLEKAETLKKALMQEYFG